jgi:hypothetical protein
MYIGNKADADVGHERLDKRDTAGQLGGMQDLKVWVSSRS